jgi:hypothetical protein
MSGSKLTRALDALADHFREWAVPQKGRYVREPAIADEQGVRHVPPPVPDPAPKIAAGVAIGAALALFLLRRSRRKAI